ncbi:MAG TPA: hypothetical protein VGU71_04660 [Candidatus Dormibacteraeota bacterium]|nr:hypothetical protein [Candidatus Dormibacteraeota bacterium]
MNGLAATRTILGAEARAIRNRLAKGSRLRLALLLVGLAIAAFFIGGGVFSGGAAIAHLIPASMDSVLSGAFTALTASMLVLGFPSVIATFFVGRDLLQLVVSPVRTAEIFAARLALAMGANLLLGAILLAGVLGIGAGAGAPLDYYLLSVAMVLIQVLLITSVQAILMSVVLRWVPARLARDVAAGVAGLAGAGFYLAWNLTLRGSYSPRSRPDLSNLTTLAQRIDWVPSAWPGHALSNLVAGNIGTAGLWALASVVLATVAVLVAEVLYERTLLAGLGVFGSTPVIWRRRKAHAQTAVRPGASADTGGFFGRSSPYLAIARKDWLGYRRDVRRLTRLLPALIFPVGYAVAFSQSSRSQSGFWGTVGLIAFLSLFMSLALASPSVPSERRGFQLLRLAPLTMWQVLRSKVLLTLPPVLAVMLVFAVAVAIVSGSRAIEMLELALLVVWLGCGFVVIAVSGGAIDPRFEALDDRRAVGILGGLSGFFASLGFGVLSVGAFALFVFGAEAVAGTAQLHILPSTPTIGVLMWALGIALLAGAAIVAGVMLWFANLRLKSFEATIAET